MTRPAPDPEPRPSLDDLFGPSEGSSGSDSLFGASPQPVTGASMESGSGPEFYETWWFWTAVGVGLAGAGVGTAWALGAFDAEEQPLFTGTVVFP